MHKRIFPSLYSMFVSSVSVIREDSRLTAARKVAKELGLTRARDVLEGHAVGKINPLSKKLFLLNSCCREKMHFGQSWRQLNLVKTSVK